MAINRPILLFLCCLWRSIKISWYSFTFSLYTLGSQKMIDYYDWEICYCKNIVYAIHTHIKYACNIAFDGYSEYVCRNAFFFKNILDCYIFSHYWLSLAIKSDNNLFSLSYFWIMCFSFYYSSFFFSIRRNWENVAWYSNQK